jgi:hypothetical protein
MHQLQIEVAAAVAQVAPLPLVEMDQVVSLSSSIHNLFPQLKHSKQLLHGHHHLVFQMLNT